MQEIERNDEDEVELKRKSNSRLNSWKKIVPIMFLYYLCLFMILPLGSQLIISLVCEQMGSNDCNSSEVSSKASMVSLYTSIANNVPALLFAGPYGSLTDRFGRKLAMLMPLLGFIFTLAGYYYVALVRPLSSYIYIIIIGNILQGFSGGGGVMQMGIFTYTSDITEDNPSSRTAIFSIIESTLFFAKIIGPPIGGIWAKQRGIGEPILVSMIMLTVMCAWTQFGVKESLSANDPVRKKEITYNPLKTFQNLQFICTMKEERGSNPIPYVLFSYFIMLCVVIGNIGVIIFYVTYKFNWSSDEIGYYLALEGVVQTLSMLFLPTVVEKLFKAKLDNIYWISGGYLMRGISYLAIGLCGKGFEVFACTVIFLFTGPYYPRNRVLLSNAVTSVNQATMQSAIAAIDSLASFFAPLFTLTYSYTVHDSPSIVYFLMASLAGLAFITTFYTITNPQLFRNFPESKGRIIDSKLAVDSAVEPLIFRADQPLLDENSD